MAEFSQTGFVDVSIPTAPKRLIICCDGTWQSSVSGLKNIPSNVTRIARSIARSGRDGDKIWQQIVHYDAGIGTGDLSKSEKDRQGGFGIGFLGNVIEAYSFLAMNYALGDEIFCFGFSRGAYTARAVAGLVNDIGIISPKDLQDFPDLYALYQKNEDSQGFRKSKAYREWCTGVLSTEQPATAQTEGGFNPNSWPTYSKPAHAPAPEASRVVQVVGVFDTVGSLGVPKMTWTDYNMKFLASVCGVPNVGFHNVSLSPYIRHAYHALALDEHRGPFSPTLWHFPTDGRKGLKKPTKSIDALRNEFWTAWGNKSSSEDNLTALWDALIDGEAYQELKDAESELQQVWFPGVHINIGGGSDDLITESYKGDFEQIALVSLAWMCEQTAPYLQFSGTECNGGSLGDLAQRTVDDRFYLLRPMLAKIAAGEKDFGSGMMSNVWSLLDKTGLKKAKVRELALNAVNGWATGPIVDSFSGSMAIAGSVTRTPGQYKEDKSGKTTVKLGPTNEFIHPSVQYRILKDKEYKPPALKGYDRVACKNKNDGYQWVKGDTIVPEFIIKAEDYFSRHVAMQDTTQDHNAQMFIGQIDRDIGQQSFESKSLDNVDEWNKQQKLQARHGYSG